MIRRIMKIASKIAKDTMEEIEQQQVEAFEMTEREWESYSQEHPNAKKENHTIIPVPGKSHKDSEDFNEYMRREAGAKIEYFKKMKSEHPNYIPMIDKNSFMDILLNGQYSCISAGVNGEDEEDVRRAQEDKNFIKRRTEQLRKDLDRLGVKYTEIVGSYFGGEEPSFMISHNLKAKTTQNQEDNSFFVSGETRENNDNIIKELNRLGRKYNQNSVAHGNNGIMEWHFTTGSDAGTKSIGQGTNLLDDSSGNYSEARLDESDFTLWSCDMDNTFKKGYKKQKIDEKHWPED